MKLAKLLSPWVATSLPDLDISGLHNDSREVKPGYLFFAYPGASADGRLFLLQARLAGADRAGDRHAVDAGEDGRSGGVVGELPAAARSQGCH